MPLLGAYWLRCQWPQVTDGDTEASLALTRLWGQECLCNTWGTAVTTTPWESVGGCPVPPPGADTRSSRRPLPALRAPALHPHPHPRARWALPIRRGLISPWPTRSCKRAAEGLSLPQRTGHGCLQESKHVHDTCEKIHTGVATHSSVLAWRIPGTGEPGGLPSMGSQRVGHD